MPQPPVGIPGNDDTIARVFQSHTTDIVTALFLKYPHRPSVVDNVDNDC
jgi:hypothetical protein